MPDLLNKATMFFLNIFIISIILFHITSASDPQCSPSKNLKWNIKKQKCVKCGNCKPGHFRNLTEPYTKRIGKHGAERCLRCRPCPKGRYSRNGYDGCSKCVVNCTELYREFAEPCTKLHDAKCGSCLNGFYDTFKNTQFPCAPKKPPRQPRILEPPRTPSSTSQELHSEDSKHPIGSQLQSDVVGSSKVVADTEINDATNEQYQNSPLKNPTTTVSDIDIGMIVAGVACALVSSVVGIAVVRRRNRSRVTQRRNEHNLTTQGAGRYTVVNDLSRDNDIEMDTFGLSDESGTIYYNPMPQTELEAVRSELAPSVQPNLPPYPRAELSHLSPTDNIGGIIYIQLSGGSSDVFCYERCKDFCRCRVDKREQCNCRSYDFLDDICIEKSDRYVLEVATNVCHDPCTLFYNLGLQDATIYQENNSRDRDPVKITQKEFVINLLHRWIEVKASQATLKQLSLALCNADFHEINSKLYDLYSKNILTV